MLYGLVLTVHVIVCIVLIFVVLLQAGRGGGFSDMLGGGQPQSLFGTQTNAFMVKATEVCAVLFIVTSLSLGVLTTQKGKSILPSSIPATATPVPATAPEAAETVPPAASELPRMPEPVPQAPQQ